MEASRGAALRIALVGAGNVASVLGKSLHQQGCSIVSVYSRTASASSSLACELEADSFSGDHFPDGAVDLFLVSVTDDACYYVCERLAPVGVPVVHTSGSSPLFRELKCPTGVLYPLQTFSPQRADALNLRSVPFFLEASDEPTMALLRRLAARLSDNVHEADTPRRQWIHLLGTLGCNFPNYMLYMASKVCQAQRIDFELLRPLVEETVEKAFALGPAAAQTGPAVRGDSKTMRRHEAMLSRRFPQFLDLYEQISQAISLSHSLEIAKKNNPNDNP